MDFRQLEYIIQIAETNNITKAAQNLFISQSALNQQLLKLENELGIQLFHRSRTNWHLSEAGEIYVKNARECLKIKHETYTIINDLTDTKRGKLTIGLTPGRGIIMFTALYPKLHDLYPNLAINPVEMNVRKQQVEVSNGGLDIGFMTLAPNQRTNDNYIVLGSEEMVLAIPAKHPLSQYANPPGEPLATIDIRQLQHEPFVLMYSESTNRSICNEIFEAAGFLPHILFETSNTSSIVTMVESMLCCALLPRYYTLNSTDKMTLFRLTTSYSWDMVISYRKNSYLSSASQDFIRLASEYWTKKLFLK